jgi:hypothetical protein
MSLDIFGNGYTFWETVVGLFMHNIPVFVLLIILIISWKYEIIGGISFVLAGLLYIAFVIRNIIMNGFQGYYLSWMTTIAGPAFFIGILWFINWNKKK